jgi:ketosteroid isomerase-like protein
MEGINMKKILYFSWIFVLAVLAAVPAIAKDDDDSDLAGRAAMWEKEYNAGNLNGVVAMYAADGCRMPPNQPAVCGSEAILGQLTAGKQQGFAKVKVVVTSAQTEDDLGYGTGTYEILGADGSHVDHGKWMNVSKKSNGKWIIHRDIFNSDMPMPEAKK